MGEGINRALFSSVNHSWETPDNVYADLNEEFGFNFDPCNRDSIWDGLSIDWGTVTFVNPPYKRIIEWIEKGICEAKWGNTSVFLLPSRTDTKWFHLCLEKADEIRFIKGRLKFKGAKNNAPFPSVVIVFK